MVDYNIHCLKKGQPCAAGMEKLNSKLYCPTKSQGNNPLFSLSDEDDAAEEIIVIDVVVVVMMK